MKMVDLSHCPSPHSLANQLARCIWNCVRLLFFRPSPVFLKGWRRFLLRLFGAELSKGADIYPSAKIWAPWHLHMDEYSCLGPFVDCYCVAPIKIGAHATVSQYSFLCTASHDIEQTQMPLVTAPIQIGAGAWIAADVFVGPGVTVGDGAVVGARSTLLKDVEPWAVVAGNPARFIKKRILRES